MDKKVDITFLHLHTPLFFAGRNWGEKLDKRQTAKGKIEMTYWRENSEVHITCEKHFAIIPISNVVSMTPIPAEPLVEPVSKAMANAKINAQVSGPHDHVFAGLGAGQTGAGKKVK